MVGGDCLFILCLGASDWASERASERAGELYTACLCMHVCGDGCACVGQDDEGLDWCQRGPRCEADICSRPVRVFTGPEMRCRVGANHAAVF